MFQAATMDRLRRQLGDRGDDLVNELIALYLVQGRDLVGQIEAAGEALDVVRLKAAAHKLKGSTATLGGDRLAAFCQEILVLRPSSSTSTGRPRTCVESSSSSPPNSPAIALRSRETRQRRSHLSDVDPTAPLRPSRSPRPWPRRLYRQIVESGNEGIWVFDLDGTTAYVNARMAGMLGYTLEEMASISLLEVLDDEGRDQGAAFLARQRQAGGTTESAECLLLRRDGQPVWTVISHSPWRNEVPISGADRVRQRHHRKASTQ